MKSTALVFAALAVLSLVSPAAAQKGKPTPAPTQAATLTFRCDVPPPAVADPCDTSDGIRGDGKGSFSALLEGQGEAYLELKSTDLRYVWLDFRNDLSGVPPSRRHFETLPLNTLILRTNVVDASGNPVEGGLRSLAPGQVSDARLFIPFNTVNPSTNESIAWALRFYPAFAPSTHVTVRRVDDLSWDIEATAADRAVLVSGVRKSQINEGPFLMPFKARLTLAP